MDLKTALLKEFENAGMVSCLIAFCVCLMPIYWQRTKHVAIEAIKVPHDVSAINMNLPAGSSSSGGTAIPVPASSGGGISWPFFMLLAVGAGAYVSQNRHQLASDPQGT
jgi:hypothetical protein